MRAAVLRIKAVNEFPASVLAHAPAPAMGNEWFYWLGRGKRLAISAVPQA
jgi:hypothetical protein